MSTNTLLFGVLFILLAIALIFIIRTELRFKKLFRGSKADTLEGLIGTLVEEVKRLNGATTLHASDLKSLEERLIKHGRGVKLVRFNPFPDAGSNQSFAVGVVNGEGDGVVFSSLYSRERMSVFAKPIKGGKSDIELSPEEAGVVAEAFKDAQQ